MLKIKDNVDLKEILCKGFDFHPIYSENDGEIKALYTFTKKWIGIKRVKKTIIRRLVDFNNYKYDYIIERDIPFNTLYDLIKADLVEKVGDKE